MSFLTIVTIGFLVLEFSNVIVLYFVPEFKYANGIGIFKAWEKSKQDPEVHDFIKYLVNWVAGTKLIFILLLIVVLIVADEQTLIYSGVALVISIASFFWRLFPMVRKMDKEAMIQPMGYSLILGIMIGAFILIFLSAIIVAVL
jgi:hypothetical protein